MLSNDVATTMTYKKKCLPVCGSSLIFSYPFIPSDILVTLFASIVRRAKGYIKNQFSLQSKDISPVLKSRSEIHTPVRGVRACCDPVLP